MMFEVCLNLVMLTIKIIQKRWQSGRNATLWLPGSSIYLWRHAFSFLLSFVKCSGLWYRDIHTQSSLLLLIFFFSLISSPQTCCTGHFTFSYVLSNQIQVTVKMINLIVNPLWSYPSELLKVFITCPLITGSMCLYFERH